MTEKTGINLQGETITITRVTLTDAKGNIGHYITSGNISLSRAQEMLTELMVQTARQEGINQTIVKKTDKTGDGNIVEGDCTRGK